jgi:hypothetical protein
MFYQSFQPGKGKKPVLMTFIFIVLWMALQAYLAQRGFYCSFATTLSRLFYAMLPPLLVVFYVGLMKNIFPAFRLRWLTFLHMIRLPLSLLLLSLYYDKQVPVEMTFKGRDYDLLAGLTSVLFVHRSFYQTSAGLKRLLIWHVLGMLLLLHSIIMAVFSLPVSFQIFGHAQPNIALCRFPFIWLISTLSPLLLLMHLIAIRQILHHLKMVSDR